jgi:phosphoglycolate phosphatase
MKVANVKGIVWDLDGTLIDSFTIFERIIADVVQDSGHTMPTHEYMISNYHGSLEETVERILGIDSAEELNKAIDTFMEKQERHYDVDLEDHLFKDATLLAQQASKKGIPQLLVTNRNNGNTGVASPQAIVAATTLADYINEVRSGDEVEFRKPDKRSVGDWMERHNISPEHVLVIGDQYVDAQLALNLGTRALIVSRNGEIPHMEKLSHQNHKDIVIVPSLDNIKFSE